MEHRYLSSDSSGVVGVVLVLYLEPAQQAGATAAPADSGTSCVVAIDTRAGTIAWTLELP